MLSGLLTAGAWLLRLVLAGVGLGCLGAGAFLAAVSVERVFSFARQREQRAVRNVIEQLIRHTNRPSRSFWPARGVHPNQRGFHARNEP